MDVKEAIVATHTDEWQQPTNCPIAGRDGNVTQFDRSAWQADLPVQFMIFLI